jgi:hypothetical protein
MHCPRRRPPPVTWATWSRRGTRACRATSWRASWRRWARRSPSSRSATPPAWAAVSARVRGVGLGDRERAGLAAPHPSIHHPFRPPLPCPPPPISHATRSGGRVPVVQPLPGGRGTILLQGQHRHVRRRRQARSRGHAAGRPAAHARRLHHQDGESCARGSVAAAAAAEQAAAAPLVDAGGEATDGHACGSHTSPCPPSFHSLSPCRWWMSASWSRSRRATRSRVRGVCAAPSARVTGTVAPARLTPSSLESHHHAPRRHRPISPHHPHHTPAPCTCSGGPRHVLRRDTVRPHEAVRRGAGHPRGHHW